MYCSYEPSDHERRAQYLLRLDDHLHPDAHAEHRSRTGRSVRHATACPHRKTTDNPERHGRDFRLVVRVAAPKEPTARHGSGTAHLGRFVLDVRKCVDLCEFREDVSGKVEGAEGVEGEGKQLFAWWL